jgi:tetratricopeptide (TPR) repeat protein
MAQIILLLISPDFIASEYCWGVELARALERHQANQAHAIPVILRPCDWSNSPFGRLQALPDGGRPITTWPNADEAFLNVIGGIRRSIQQLEGNRESQQWKAFGQTQLANGDAVGAQGSFHRALAIDQSVYGLNHPLVGWDYNLLGKALLAQGHLSGAWDCHMRAYQIAMAAYGQNHPDVAIALENVGAVHLAGGRLQDAWTHYSQVGQFYMRLFGPNHALVASCYTQLGIVAFRMKNWDTSKACHEQSIDIHRTIYGPNHIYTAASLALLADVLAVLGDRVQAREHYKKSLSIIEPAYGANSPLANIIRQKLESVLTSWDKFTGFLEELFGN